MNKISVGGFTRITRKEARKRYNAGEVVRMCAVNMSPVNMWDCFVDCCREAFPPIAGTASIPWFPVPGNLIPL